MASKTILAANLHRSMTPALEVGTLLNRIDIALVQELPLNKEKLPMNVGRTNIISGGISPRAAIYANPSVNVIPCAHLTTPDLAVAIWQHSKGRVMIVSGYMDITQDQYVILNKLKTNYIQKVRFTCCLLRRYDTELFLRISPFRKNICKVGIYNRKYIFVKVLEIELRFLVHFFMIFVAVSP